MLLTSSTGVRCRRITDDDLAAVADLLSRGFRFRPQRYWLRGFKRLAERPRPESYPAYGYLLASGGRVVGALLMLFSEVTLPQRKVIRCNLSSWYVEPAYRNFGSLLVTSAIKDKTVTYFNVSPARGTWATVEAQGFSVYCRGQIYALPALSRPVTDTRIDLVDDNLVLELPEAELLRQHARLGCLSLVVRHNDENHPFVFRRIRLFKRLVPCYQLTYCRDTADVSRFAGNIGRFLLKRGRPLLVVDANAPVAGLVGVYSERQGRKYGRGPNIPELGDLAFTEGVFF